MIIGIAGRAQSGKDTLATMLQQMAAKPVVLEGATLREKPEVAVGILHFADALRDAVEAIFGCRYETQEEKTKIDEFWQKRLRHDRGSRVHEHRNAAGEVSLIRDYGDDDMGSKDLTGRWILQCMGTEIGRNQIHKDIWLFAMERRIAKSKAKHHVIADIRFDNEAKWVKDSGGVVIGLARGGQPPLPADAHASERGVSWEFLGEAVTCQNLDDMRTFASITAKKYLI